MYFKERAKTSKRHVKFQGRIQEHVTALLSRVGQPAHFNAALENLGHFLQATAPHIHLPSGSAVLKHEKKSMNYVVKQGPLASIRG